MNKISYFPDVRTRRSCVKFSLKAGALAPLTKPLPICGGINYSNVVNVKSVGAVGDGTTDDTGHIQNAVNSVSASPGGGIVFFPPGQYLVQQIPNKAWCVELKSNVLIMGIGTSSCIKLADSQSKFTRIFSTNYKVANSNIHFSNLCIDGNKSNQDPTYEQQHSILLDNASNCSVKYCVIHDTVGDGVYVHAGGRSYGSQGIDVSYNEMHDIDRVGINFAGASFSVASYNYIHDTPNNSIKMEQNGPSAYCSHNRFSHNRIENTGGIALSGGGGSSNITLSDIDIHDNRFYDMIGQAVNIGEVSDICIYNNSFGFSKGQTVCIRSSKNIFLANNDIFDVKDTGQYSACVKVHSDYSSGLGAPSENIVIINNTFRNNERMNIIVLRDVTVGEISGNKIAGGKAGIVLDHNTTDMLVMNNEIDDNDKYGILTGNAASGNVFRDNRIINNKIGARINKTSGPGNEFGNDDEFGRNLFLNNNQYDLWNQHVDPLYAKGNTWDNNTPNVKGNVVT